MPDRVQLSRSLAVFKGYDAGDHGLPQPLLDARAAYQRVTAASREPGDTRDPEPQLRQDAARRFAETGEIDVDPILSARDAFAVHHLRGAIIREAVDIAANRLYGAVEAAADEIVTDHLAPRQAEILEEFAAATNTYRKHGSDAASLLQAPAPARAAFSKVSELLRAYQSVRSTLAAVRIATSAQVQYDDANMFLLIRNTEQIWPEIITSQFRPTVPPWPTEPLPYLEWLATSDAQPWCPTVDQQDERYLEVFGERIQRDRAYRQQMRGFRELHG